MKVILESTTKLVELETPSGVVPARIWEGETDSGIPVHAYVTRIAVELGQPAEQFERELLEQRPPSSAVQSIPSRLVL